MAHRTIYLKTDSDHFAAVLARKKSAEIRFNDRKYQVGDVLVLMETQRYTLDGVPDSGRLHYTGRSCTVQVTHILDDGLFLQPGYVMLSIRHEILEAGGITIQDGLSKLEKEPSQQLIRESRSEVSPIVLKDGTFYYLHKETLHPVEIILLENVRARDYKLLPRPVEAPRFEMSVECGDDDECNSLDSHLLEIVHGKE